MTSITTDRKSCSKCGFQGWVFSCDGCNASFCYKHAPDHRIELTTQLDHIQQQSNNLEQIYNPHEYRQEHPLFSQIDVWEHDTITKISQIAEIARNELRKLLDESHNQIRTIFDRFNIELRVEREKEHFTEIELEKWKEQLTNIRKQLETPPNIELIEDNNLPPIHLIKINATNQTIMATTLTVSQPVQTYSDTNDDECSCDDNTDKPQTIIIDNNETSNIETLTSCEPSTIQKHEPLTTPDSCELASTEPYLHLDPTKDYHLTLFQLSPSSNQSQLPPILSQLTDHQLQIINPNDDYLNELKCQEQTTIFIDISGVLSEKESQILNNIAELDNVYSIYIRGIPPENDEERDRFFKRYSRLKAIFDNEQQLMVQWLMDTANEYKKTGDSYVERGDKDKGRVCFEQGIALYKRLSEFLNKKRDVR